MGVSYLLGDMNFLDCLVLGLLVPCVLSSYVSQPKCTSTPSTECKEVKKPHTEHKNERKCTTVFSKDCHTEYQTVFDYTTKKQCNDVTNEVCNNVVNNVCKTIQKPVVETEY